MAGTIIPMVHRDRESGKASIALWLHAAGNIVGAAAMGGLLGLIGAALPWHLLPAGRGVTALLITGIASLVYSAREMELLRVPAAQCSRQVPRTWSYAMSTEMSSTLYGVGLGFGLATRIAVSTFYPAALWAVLVADPMLGAMGMAFFGLGRALPLIAMDGVSKDAQDRIRLTEALHNYKPLVHFINGLALGAAGACLVITGLMLR